MSKGRILAIDYGTKRTGVAVTDPLQIAANPLIGLHTTELEDYLTGYLAREHVTLMVLGLPTHPDGNPLRICEQVKKLGKKMNKLFPDLKVDYHEESFTSVKAREVLLMSGAKKKKRKDKLTIDMVSAVIILQEYLGHI